MVQYGRSSRSSWATSVRSSFGRTVMGKAIWEIPIEVRLGEGFQLGMSYSYTVGKGYSFVYVDDIKIGWKETQTLIRCGKYINKEVDLGEPTSFPDHVYLGRTQRQCEISNDIVDNYRIMFWIKNFRGRNWKTTVLGKYSYIFVVLRYGGSCQEMCGTILWVGKKDDSTTLQSIYSMHWWPSFQRRTIEICGRIVKSMLSNCSEMLFLGTYWKTWYSMASKQTCTKNHKMDQNLWQTIMNRLISYIHHTCEYKQY